MPVSRGTQKEQIERKLVQVVAGSFNRVFYGQPSNNPAIPGGFAHQERVVFAIYDKLKKYHLFGNISFNRSEDSLQVDINPKLADEPKRIQEETGVRMALKMHIFLAGGDIRETSEEYRQLSFIYHVWNYGPYMETPEPYHVYSCSRCGRHLLVYNKKLPAKAPIVGAPTIWHKHNSDSETEKAHQGRYAYSGRIVLENWEYQEIRHNMDVIKEKTDMGRNTDPTYYYEDDDEW